MQNNVDVAPSASLACRRPTASTRSRAGRRPRSGGFTLVELLIVVSMVGILAAIAIVGYRKYIHSSQSSEATAMLGSIRNSQEAFKAEAMSYLAVSGSAGGDLAGAALYPREIANLNEGKAAWINPTHTDYDNWNRLGAAAEGPVRFGYACVAAFPGDALPGAVHGSPDPNWAGAFGGSNPNEPWFVAIEVGDRDEDGRYAVFQAASFTTSVLVHEDSE